MITGELKRQVDKIWDTLWTAGITSPVTVMEQITYLLFSRISSAPTTNSDGVVSRTPTRRRCSRR